MPVGFVHVCAADADPTGMPEAGKPVARINTA
jgi:hypothetical protein